MKKTLEQEINEFLEYWNSDKMCSFLREIIPLFQLYDVDKEDDWVRDAVGEENEPTIRLIRTVYLMSRIAQIHAGHLALLNIRFKNLFKRMESGEYMTKEEMHESH